VQLLLAKPHFRPATTDAAHTAAAAAARP